MCVLRCVCGELTLCDAGASEVHTFPMRVHRKCTRAMYEDAYTSAVHTDRVYTHREGGGQKRGE